MKSILTKRYAVNLTTASLLFALIVSCSYVSLASANRPVGEILISGASVDGKSVTVNGEAAKSGRTIFDASMISTPAGQSAIVNLGRAGKIQIAPGSTVTLGLNGDAISSSVTSGSLTVLGSASPVSVTNANGETLSVASGESVTATSTSAAKAQTGPGGVNWWVWAAIIAGAATAVVLIVTLNDDDATVTSPVR